MIFNSLWPWWHHVALHTMVNIGSGNGLLPVRHQAITWTKACLLSTIYLSTIYFNEILCEIQKLYKRKMHLIMSCAKCHPFCHGLSVSSMLRMPFFRTAGRILQYVFVTLRVNSLAPGRCGSNFKNVFFNSSYRVVSWVFLGKFLLYECHRSQHCFR